MKYALCVGNNYPGTQNELSGCVNDAEDWSHLLEGAGYSVATVLEGTMYGVMNGLRGIVAQMKWGDRIVFTYSGHGTWTPDEDGDESDHRDEALYMADGKLIIDDDLQGVFSGLPLGSGALILSDSCFSGTVSRLAPWVMVEHSVYRVKPRFISPALVNPRLSLNEVREFERVTTSTPPRGTASLISGASDLEYSYDAWFGDRPNGAFTRAAIDAYTPGASLARWFKNIRTTLPNDTYPQSPQLTAASLYRRYARAL